MWRFARRVPLWRTQRRFVCDEHELPLRRTVERVRYAEHVGTDSYTCTARNLPQMALLCSTVDNLKNPRSAGRL